uniref:Uncharacterized protein n=1 Tax=Aegilops tauschii subsp. strangulata TaxID=200361 RepID=A0A453L5H2_AEGTS
MVSPQCLRNLCFLAASIDHCLYKWELYLMCAVICNFVRLCA